jgi:catechol 2,3-dioxygenase-like lactoylglutathione lyase family enzyme
VALDHDDQPISQSERKEQFAMTDTPHDQGAGDGETTTSAADAEWPRPKEGFVVTHLLIVRDIDRSRRFYSEVLGARTLMEGPPAILRFANTWLVLNTGGGPTDDKPDVVAAAPSDPNTLTSALNIRVADIQALYQLWSSRGARFLTPPMDHSAEIRCYLRDPDGHLIEVGQTTARAAAG